MDTILDYLVRDQRRCDTLLAQAIDFVHESEWLIADLAVNALGSALRRHIRIEEELVFNAVDALVSSAVVPTTLMRSEHERLRAMVHQLDDAAARRHQADFCACASLLQIVLQLHFDKESSGFFPLAGHVLAPQRARLNAALGGFPHDGPDLFASTPAETAGI
jgi:hemerythrin-like domain-containing protein